MARPTLSTTAIVWQQVSVTYSPPLLSDHYIWWAKLTYLVSLGKRIRAVRKQARLSQEAFGSMFGYTRHSVIAWEAGSAEPPLSLLSKLRDLLDVDPEWVLLGEDETPKSHYGPADWARFDRLVADVRKVCIGVGLELPAERHQALARVLYDAGDDAGSRTRSQLRGMLLALAEGK